MDYIRVTTVRFAPVLPIYLVRQVKQISWTTHRMDNWTLFVTVLNPTKITVPLLDWFHMFIDHFWT